MLVKITMTDSTEINIGVIIGLILGIVSVLILVYTMGNEVVNVDVLDKMCEKLEGDGSTFVDSFGPTTQLVCVITTERVVIPKEGD